MSYKPLNIRGTSVSGSGTVRCGRMLGIDGNMSENLVSLSRADAMSYFDGIERPGSVNMIRTSIGEVSKRPGFVKCSSVMQGVFCVHTVKSIYGNIRFYAGQSSIVVQNEDGSIRATISTPGDFSDSRAVAADKYVYFMNGSYILIYCLDGGSFYIKSDGTNNIAGADIAYLPTIFIGCIPEGAGSAYQPVNLISPYVAEQYVSDGVSTEYNLHLEPDGYVKAYEKTQSGGWSEISGVSQTGKKVTFTSPPSASMTEGEDNIRIVYKRTGFDQNAKKIACCTCGTVFGVSGYKDRVFLSGNNDYPGNVYYTEMSQPLYFPDLNYIKTGTADTRVRALAGENTSLAVMCDDGNIYTVGCAVNDENEDSDFEKNARFFVSGIMHTPMPVTGVPPVVFAGELVYLTESGLCAVTASGVLDERCCQHRSGRLDRYILNGDLCDMRMMTFGDFLILSDRRDLLYILDGKQFSTDANTPFSSRQYEGYIWTGICAKSMWEFGGALYFTDGSSIFCFNSGFKSNNEYRDQLGSGQYRTIAAYWETPYIRCTDFNINKFFMRLGVQLSGKYGDDGVKLNTGIKIYAKFDEDDWRVVKDYDGAHRVFRYSNISYQYFVYGNKHKSYGVYKRLFHKKGRSVKLRFENSNVDEPFTLQGFNIEYVLM